MQSRAGERYQWGAERGRGTSGEKREVEGRGRAGEGRQCRAKQVAVAKGQQPGASA